MAYGHAAGDALDRRLQQHRLDHRGGDGSRGGGRVGEPCGRLRRRHPQDALASAAGGLQPGASTSWAIHHKLPLLDDVHGRVTVIRDIPNRLAPCKEVVFVLLGGKRDLPIGAYTTPICQDSTGWRWAAAEPAVRRWGYLQ